MAAQFEIKFTLGAQTVNRLSPSYSDANGQRFSNWIWAAYPQVDANGDPLPDTPQNRAASFRAWADGIFAGTKANVLRHEDQTLKAAAVPPDLSPA